LIGTALAAKALDLPRLALVGVVSADAGLLLPDERAAERVVARVVQAAGRLGRGDDAGIAIIQTYRPDDPAILAAVAAARGDSPRAWREREIALRRAAGGAPFLRTAKLTVAAPTVAGAERRGRDLAERLKRAIAADSSRGTSRLLGPIPAWVPYRDGRWRHNVILRDREPLELIGTLASRDLMIDLDPETLL
jgi:primosomal protein N' (replication factor Y)